MRPLLSIAFPQGFRISKNIGHPTSGSGVPQKGTDRRTGGQTDISTYRKHRLRGPML